MLKCFYLVLSILLLFELNIQKVFATDCEILITAISSFDPVTKNRLSINNCCNELTDVVKCNAQGQVTELRISDVENGIKDGPLDLEIFFAELTKLEYLETLELRHIIGSSLHFYSLPSSIGLFKALKNFKFSDSTDIFQFTSLPGDIGNIVTLERLDLSNNGFVGDLPTSIGKLKSLTYLNLNGNSFTGYIPYDFANLENLTELYLGGNSLDGFVPYLPNLQKCNYENSKICNLSNAKCISGEDICTEDDIKYANLHNGNPDPSSQKELDTLSKDKDTDKNTNANKSENSKVFSSTHSENIRDNKSKKGGSNPFVTLFAFIIICSIIGCLIYGFYKKQKNDISIENIVISKETTPPPQQQTININVSNTTTPIPTPAPINNTYIYGNVNNGNINSNNHSINNDNTNPL